MKTTNHADLQPILDAIRAQHFAIANEYDLQVGLYDALALAGFASATTREVVLFGDGQPLGRVDLFVHPGLAIEVKTQGTAAAARRQVMRYLKSPAVEHVLLVTTQARHAEVAGECCTVEILRGSL